MDRVGARGQLFGQLRGVTAGGPCVAVLVEVLEIVYGLGARGDERVDSVAEPELRERVSERGRAGFGCRDAARERCAQGRVAWSAPLSP